MSGLESVKDLESVRVDRVRNRKCSNWKVSELENVRSGKCQNYLEFDDLFKMRQIRLGCSKSLLPSKTKKMDSDTCYLPIELKLAPRPGLKVFAVRGDLICFHIFICCDLTCRVDSPLVEDGMDSVVEELCDQLGRALQGHSRGFGLLLSRSRSHFLKSRKMKRSKNKNTAELSPVQKSQ